MGRVSRIHAPCCIDALALASATSRIWGESFRGLSLWESFVVLVSDDDLAAVRCNGGR